MGTMHGSTQLSRLRRRFILTALIAFTVVLTIICVIINLWNYHLICQRADDMINLIYENGAPPSKPSRPTTPSTSGLRITAETPFKTRYFIVTFNKNGEIDSLDASHIAMIDKSDIKTMASEILKGSQQRGFQGTYRFALFNSDDTSTVVVLDCIGDLDAFTLFRNITIIVCATCVVITLGLLIPLSKRAMQPFMANSERQRRFVTDASHELKTPISIISANNDLTEQLSGPTPWTESTRRQIKRIDQLVKDLVELSRADETLDETASKIDLSLIAQETVDEFSPLARAAGKDVETTIESALCVLGNKTELERLIGILFDNAIKYCDGEEPIRFELKNFRHHAQIVISNPCSNLSPADIDHIFDRFYRADPSRARATGSYGIGLALARAIVQKHEGDIQAELKGRIVRFLITFPLYRA